MTGLPVAINDWHASGTPLSPQPLTVEEATQRLKDTWAQDQDLRVAL